MFIIDVPFFGLLTAGLGAVAAAVLLAGVAVGVVGVVTTEQIATMFQEAEKVFNELTDVFNDALLYALSKTKNDVDTVRTQVIDILDEIEQYQAENEVTGHVLDHQQEIFSQYAKEMSTCVNSLKKKSEQIDKIVSSLFNA